MNLTNVTTEVRSWMIMKEHGAIELWQKVMQKVCKLHGPRSWGSASLSQTQTVSLFGTKIQWRWKLMSDDISCEYNTKHFTLFCITFTRPSFIHLQKCENFCTKTFSLSTCWTVAKFKDTNFRLWLYDEWYIEHNFGFYLTNSDQMSGSYGFQYKLPPFSHWPVHPF